ncbi:MAG: hypothetical protein QM759_11415 [Terricaulis sp.]
MSLLSRRVLAVAVLAVAHVVAPAASAAPFQAAYAPRVGQHAEIRMRKCQDATENGQAPTHHCATFVYDEEIVAAVRDGYRIRYTARAVEGAGTPAQNQAVLAQLQAAPLDVVADASGTPIAFQDRAEFFAHLRAALPQDDPAAVNATMNLFARMDDRTAVTTFSKDFAPLSAFQGLDAAEVGTPESRGVSAPFPLLPSQPVDGTQTFALDSVDAHAGTAAAHFETTYSAESLTRAIAALRASVAGQGRAMPSNLEVRMSERSDGVIDIATGAVKHVHNVRTADVVQDTTQLMHRVDTLDLDRRVISR